MRLLTFFPLRVHFFSKINFSFFDSWFSHKLEIHCQDLSLALSMSTVIGLNDLAEDEIIPKPLPMQLLLNNLKLTLIEDRPPVNITSPGSVPINLEIGKMQIKRNELGIFEIQPEIVTQTNLNEDVEHVTVQQIEKRRKDRDRELIALQLVMQQLKLDNDSLKTQLTSVQKANESDT